MSKIFYKKGTARTETDRDAAEKAAEEIAATDGTESVKDGLTGGTSTKDVNLGGAGGKDSLSEGAENGKDDISDGAKSGNTDGAENGNDGKAGEESYLDEDDDFDKDRLVKYFRRHPKNKINTRVERYTPDLNEGLTAAQVQTRFSQFLFNDTNKKYSKSYASIFIGNICTFFNLLCLLAFIALILAGTKQISNYLVIFITTANIVIGIIQEIRSKLSIDRLSILAANTAKVMRGGEVVDIPLSEIVLDDVILLETGNQVPADCILAEGSVEVNESLLTGESVSVKKNVGDVLFAGSFISSGNGK